MARVLLALLIASSSTIGLANSCCGQSPASFPILSLEQRLSVVSSFSMVETQGRVNNSGEFDQWDDQERTLRSTQLLVSTTLGPRHQAFFGASLLEGTYSDSYNSGSQVHMGDTQLGYSYEVLPEYSFSYWKPLVYLSVLGNLPTGHSIYEESSLSEGAGVTGHNQWGVGLGLTVRKVYFPLTLTVQVKSLKIFSRSFERVFVSDFYDQSLALLVNYATRFWGLSLNSGVTSNLLSSRQISTSANRSGSMYSTNLLFGLQKPLTDSLGVGLNYVDQTLIGEASNTLLNRTYSISINYNYF